MKNLENKTIIITGSSRGLGKSLALALANSKVNVVINYNTNENEANDLVKQIESNGGVAIAIRANVSKSSEVTVLFDKVIEHFGKIDIVINNAGIMITKLLKDFSEEELDAHYSINIKSVFLMMKVASEKMEHNGRIINISSSTTRLMMPTYAIYSSTKAAVEQMTKVFAKEIADKGITVNAIAPGPMNTELFLKGKSPEQIQTIANASAFKRIGNTEDIIPIIEFLCSNESQWVTGQVIGVNGGMV